MFVRRLITVPVLFAATALVTLTLPVLLLVAALLSLLPATRGALATTLFLTGYLWCETVGVIGLFWIWLRHRRGPAFLAASYTLQYRWTMALKTFAERAFRLEFHVDGADALDGAAIVLPRHASIADTIIPMAFYAIPQQIKLRYVLKRELLIDPCLDIAGNRLPNYFVDRGGADSERERQGIADLASDLGPRDGVLIYVEGTRWSAAKHAALATRFSDDARFLAELERWPLLLPPRMGGLGALLDSNRSLDLLFCAHVGFEGSSHFSTLVNGSWLGARIEMTFWRVPAAAVPREPEALRAFMAEQWDRMQGWVAAHQAGR